MSNDGTTRVAVLCWCGGQVKIKEGLVINEQK